MLQKLVLIALGGALGSLARYGFSGAVHRWLGPGFPWGTAAVNLLGCFGFGILWAVMVERWAASPEVRSLVLVGFLGAFTTFSTFIAESGNLAAGGQWLFSALNVAGQAALGLFLYFLGLSLGRMI